VWLKSKKKNNVHLKHVVNGFKAIDYNVLDIQDNNISDQDWNVLWSHHYPFNELGSLLKNLKSTHCINHFPGTGFITNKVSLASSEVSSIPKAYRIPNDIDSLLKFAKQNPETMYVQKSNNHRGIEIKKAMELDFKREQSFVQQFIHNPLLVDGYKFDIGVYTVITSVNPLRVYCFEEVLFRFCTEKYHPFMSNDTRKYVVGNDYLPTWKVPSLRHFYNEQKLGMKNSFNLWLKNQKKNPRVIWNQVEESIRRVFLSNEDSMSALTLTYSPHLRFFELMRFDFIIDENLNVFLMEANMSPNLSSAHFEGNRLLYEQVVFQLLGLVGVASKRCGEFSSPEDEMPCSRKDVSVFHEHCSVQCTQKDDCLSVNCQLCQVCLGEEQYEVLRSAFLEHSGRGSYRRIMPRPLKKEEVDVPIDSENLSPMNTLMGEWFRGKCLLDVTFCS
ncbi:UNVERIFIED_CONTAM: hypothetical protein GTU68_056073, partial [Idotea baltica]|nr:hypothetical protein [Idotea baltica]